jgi:uncharacterized protein
MYYEWDETKRLKNLQERQIDFQDADLVFASPERITLKQSGYGEERYLAIAPVEGRLHALVYTMRGDVVRVISYRKARHPKETAIYDQEYHHR